LVIAGWHVGAHPAKLDASPQTVLAVGVASSFRQTSRSYPRSLPASAQ